MSRESHNQFKRPRPFYATCDSGFEDLLARELELVGAVQVSPGHRGVGFFGTRDTMVRANLESFVANRILLPIAESQTVDRESLYAAARRINWDRWFGPDQTIAVDASSHKSELTHTAFIAQVVKDGVCDYFRDSAGRRPSVDRRGADVVINARIDRDHCVISIDTSGRRLFRRGYRRQAGDAPIKETLAAGILMRSQWSAGGVLIDPMCGSGTFLAEAALMATDTAPGFHRVSAEGFGFMRLRGHDRQAFDRYLEELDGRRVPLEKNRIIGADRDAAVLDYCRRNLDRLQISHLVGLRCAGIAQFKMPEDTPNGERLVVSNPPYGERLESAYDLSGTYREIGALLKREFRGSRAVLIVGDEAPKTIGLRPESKRPMRNGQLPCHLLEFVIHAAAHPSGHGHS